MHPSRLLSLLIVVAVPLSGCASASGSGAPVASIASIHGAAPGVTTIRFANQLDDESELARLVVSIDGQPLPLLAVPPAGHEAVTLAALHLAPGAHTISTRISSKRRGDGGSMGVVASEAPFWVTAKPASIGLRVRSSAFGAAVREAEGAEAAVVELSMLGGRIASNADVEPRTARSTTAIETLADACHALTPIQGALCRTAKELETAARGNDVVASFCLHEKLDEMRRLAGVADTSDADGKELAEGRVAAVAKLAERCLGTVAPAVTDGVTVTLIVDGEPRSQPPTRVPQTPPGFLDGEPRRGVPQTPPGFLDGEPRRGVPQAPPGFLDGEPRRGVPQAPPCVL